MPGSLRTSWLFQIIIYCVTFVFLCSPLALHLITKPGVYPGAGTSRDPGLHGYTRDTGHDVPFCLASFLDRSYQERIQDYAAKSLPLRSYIVRINNQFYYSFFDKSYMYSAAIIPGKQGYLYELPYILNLNMQRNPELWTVEQIERSVRKIKDLQDFFTKRGQCFLYLVTPSKAECYPEFVPGRYKYDKSLKPLKYEYFIRELEKARVTYIDAFELTMKNRYAFDVLLFPEKGTHWNKLGAVLAAREIVSALKKRGIEMDDLKFTHTVSNRPEGSDQDLLLLANLLFRYRFPVPKIRAEMNGSSRLVKMAAVGGSFLELPMELLVDYDFFREIVYFNYFDRSIFRCVKGSMDAKNPAVEPDKALLYSPLFESGVVLLEENITDLGSGNVDKLHEFIFGKPG